MTPGIKIPAIQIQPVGKAPPGHDLRDPSVFDNERPFDRG